MTTPANPICYVCQHPVETWQPSVTGAQFPLGAGGEAVATIRHANPMDHKPTKKEPTE